MSAESIDYTKVPSTKTMAGNTIWNLIGMGLPMVVGLIAIIILPDPERGLGRERMELLGIAWMLVGFTSIFDMGLGRALTKLFADKLSTGRNDEIHGLFWTAIMMIVGLGVVVCCIVLAAIPLITSGEISPDLLTESRNAFIIVALAMPIIVLDMGICGVLQACQKFKLLNMIRIPSGVFTFLSPLCVLLFSRRLDVVVLVLVIGRSLAMVGYFLGCLSAMPSLRRFPEFRRSELSGLVHFGSWMTASNMSVNFMNHINRIIIRAIRKLGEGTFYLIPEEIVVRLLMIPRAWIDVLFPAFVTSFNSDEGAPGDLCERSMLYLLFVTLPISMVMVIAAPLFFEFLLPEGKLYLANSTFVVQCLSVGVFIHGFGRLAWAFLQAAGRPDKAAILHLIELPFYICGAYILISRYGINGAAIAWTARATIDFVVLLIMCANYINRPMLILARICAPIVVGVIMILLTIVPSSLWLMCSVGVGLLIIFYIASWLVILTTKEKDELTAFLEGVIRKIRA